MITLKTQMLQIFATVFLPFSTNQNEFSYSNSKVQAYVLAVLK